jgi:hypothetical protein
MIIIREGSGFYYSPYTYYLKLEDGTCVLIASNNPNDDISDLGDDSLHYKDLDMENRNNISVEEYLSDSPRIALPVKILERIK